MAGSLDPQAQQQLTVLRRKEVQRQRLSDYEEAVITLKAKVKDAEGQAMRETVQDKVCTFIDAVSPCCIRKRLVQCSLCLCSRAMSICCMEQAYNVTG